MSLPRVSASRGWSAAWDRATPRERTLLRVGAAVVVLAVLYALAWPPLTRDIDRTRESLARDRARLEVLKTYARPAASGRTADAPNDARSGGDARAAVERALDARGLRAAATQLDAREGRATVVLAAVPFDTLVALLDDLARTERLRVVDARLAARVEPGTVRAELTLAR